MKWLNRFLAGRRHKKQIAWCKKYGHEMLEVGSMEEAKMVGGVPVAMGPAPFKIMGCKCGHNEIVPLETGNYIRPYAEGEQLKQEQGKR